ncbi:MFS transporter [Synoicihabitans lomoniglobus]|uniref:MFS transporter n=1 Tax=Synoicihabitans lomoniglobus TaxID=2909285 RepID=A0AAF0CQ16_9BACT|nr:MFS transporter [Opitutaceae bacterium LMO-M01]WED65950.1 MFS transporter [Opitutaceae bacterium LMO-M01]
MKPNLWPIRTGQKHAPWIWVFLLSGPWAAKLYFEQISQVAITFKLSEFTNVPALITAVGSFNLLFNIFVGATCNYSSDRVWTRWGRRKPFLLVGWGTIAIGCIILPQISTLWLLITALFFYEMLRDVDNPAESLINEVVPPKQRGRSQATMTFVREALKVLFFAVLIGRWDEVYHLPFLGTVTGDKAVFWTGTVIALGTMAFVGFGIKETPPAVLPPKSPPLTVARVWTLGRDFVRNVFGEPQWRPIYAVAVSQMIFWIGFGSLTPLLFTEEWGLSKQTYGNIIALGSPFVLLICLPLGGWISDRLDRLVLYKILAAGVTACHLVFFVYLKLRVGDDASPPFGAILTYWLIHTGIGSIGVVCTVSMMFDFVPRHRLGTVSAGIGITRGVASIFVNNGIGLWVTGASHFSGEAAVGTYDYESGFLYLVGCGCLSTWVAFWFARQVNSGRIKKLGVLEAEQADPAAPLP